MSRSRRFHRAVTARTRARELAAQALIDASQPPAKGKGRRRTRGQAVTELALILPVFLLLTVGVVDMARMFIDLVSLQNGVREAAIFAGVSANNGFNYNKWCTDPANKAATPAVSVPCPAGVTNANKSADPDNIAYRIDSTVGGMDPAHVVLAPPAVAVDANCDTSIVGSGRHVTITATYRFVPLTPIISSIFSSGIPMTAKTTTCVF